VAFGDLANGTLAYACIWSVGGTAVEADIKLNKADYKFVAAIGNSCAGRWSVEAVATHEMGHVFGLAHVSEEAHGNLTMSTHINKPCGNAEASLGRGDVRGLRKLY
jgi:predicted Zn-dependent protease